MSQHKRILLNGDYFIDISGFVKAIEREDVFKDTINHPKQVKNDITHGKANVSSLFEKVADTSDSVLAIEVDKDLEADLAGSMELKANKQSRKKNKKFFGDGAGHGKSSKRLMQNLALDDFDPVRSTALAVNDGETAPNSRAVAQFMERLNEAHVFKLETSALNGYPQSLVRAISIKIMDAVMGRIKSELLNDKSLMDHSYLPEINLKKKEKLLLLVVEELKKAQP